MAWTLALLPVMAALLFAQANPPPVPREAVLQNPDDEIAVGVSTPHYAFGTFVFRGTVCRSTGSGTALKWVLEVSGEIRNETPDDVKDAVVVFTFTGGKGTARYEMVPKDLAKSGVTKVATSVLVSPPFSSCKDVRRVSVLLEPALSPEFKEQQRQFSEMIGGLWKKPAADEAKRAECRQLFVKLADRKKPEISARDSAAVESCKSLGLYK